MSAHWRCFPGFGLPALGAFRPALYHIFAAVPATLGVRAFICTLDDTGGICKAMEEGEEWHDARCTVSIGSRRMLR